MQYRQNLVTNIRVVQRMRGGPAGENFFRSAKMGGRATRSGHAGLRSGARAVHRAEHRPARLPRPLQSVCLARGISILGILALGMAVVVTGRGLDLSQIVTLAVRSAISVTLVNAGMPLAAALVFGPALPLAISVINGVLISIVDIPAIFTTLATGIFMLAVTRVLVMPHNQVCLEPGHDWFLKLGGTVAGRFIYAHGDNPQAAELSGIAVCRLTILEYCISAAIGCLGGIMIVASTSLMYMQIAESTMIFDVILVAMLGGISLAVGFGNAFSVVAGILPIGVTLNAMTILNFDIQTQNIIKGAVLLLAVILDNFALPRPERRWGWRVLSALAGARSPRSSAARANGISLAAASSICTAGRSATEPRGRPSRKASSTSPRIGSPTASSR
ncbi:hypothetical protein GC173_03180 [bacterium]|nr:hypothetical protein [bacterium]